MIGGWLRMALLGFVLLTLLYWLVSVYARSLRREALERAWQDGDHSEDRAQFVEDGLRAYRKSLQPRLLLLIYVVPAVVVPAIVYVLNYG
jgi:hypothetical protein